MNIVYRVESTAGKDRASVIENCEKEGWNLYKIDENFISFKREVPSHFISRYYVIHGNNERMGPYESEEKAKEAGRGLFSVYIERVWQNPEFSKNYSRMDRVVFLIIDDFGEEITEKLSRIYSAETPQELSQIIRDFDGTNYIDRDIRPNLMNPSNLRSTWPLETSLVTIPADPLAARQAQQNPTITSTPFGRNSDLGRMPGLQQPGITLFPRNENQIEEERRRAIRSLRDYAELLTRPSER